MSTSAPPVAAAIPKLGTFSRTSPLQTLTIAFPRKPPSLFFNCSLHDQHHIDDEEHVIGDCLVFEEDAFDDPFLNSSSDSMNTVSKKGKLGINVEVGEDLVPDKWKEVRAEINVTKKERRRMAREMEFGRSVQKRLQGLAPVSRAKLDDYAVRKNEKLAQLNPVVLDKPSAFRVEERDETNGGEGGMRWSERVAPRNPRLAVYGCGLDDITEFFNSEVYDPSAKRKTKGRRKLFTKEEKVQLSRRIPELADATCAKWLPLHTLVASGEFYLMDTLLKHNVDINARDKYGLTALHKATLSKKQAIFNYLLRESANPFVCDNEGATLMHYAVRAASSQMIKILLLYNVDINVKDNDGWTPLHLAVQTRRTDIVRLLLMKGADKTLKNNDGLNPVDLCLYLGRDARTYALIKLLKLPPKPRQLVDYQPTYEN